MRFKFVPSHPFPTFIKQVTKGEGREGAKNRGLYEDCILAIAFNGEEGEGAIVMQRSDDGRAKSERLELFAPNTDSDIIVVERGSLDYPGVSFRNAGPERR